HTDCPLTDFRGKTSIFSHPVYLFLRKFSLQDSRGGSRGWVQVRTFPVPVRCWRNMRQKVSAELSPHL
ncbi:hypothetical protein C6556_20340, partial [Escherichia coli]|nr:hypothetical protein [Escherichia coli]NYW93823.1 hypothetical protein [Escherichia coli]NYY51991.1 hypothetical protein [Escherichia coli]